MKTRLKNGIALSLLPQIILVKWLGSNPELVESHYSNGIYPILAKLLRLCFGWIPFSMGDLLYLGLGFLAIRYFYRFRKDIRKKPLLFFRDVAMTLSIGYFIFHLFWGMNYYRLPIGEMLRLENTAYSPTQLQEFCAQLVEEANEIQLHITNDSLEAVRVPYSKKEIYVKTLDGYAEIKKRFPFLSYDNKSIKTSLFSLPLTYMGYGGYLNPFTNEAQVNGKIPIVRFPTVSAHEIGHQIGYASEGETNLIGFIVTAQHKDPFFKYTAKTHALAYCLSDLRARDSLAVQELLNRLNPGILKNYQEISAFWERYENPTEPIFKSIFSTFLKANNQKDGIRSYNRVVGLLMAYDKKYGF